MPTPAAAPTLAADDVKQAKALADRIRARFSQTLIGQEHLRESLILTMVAGGHNFRPTPASRVRHRMYHKLNGFLAKHDRNLCVGCGRCVSACKVDISPIEVLKFFDRKGA